MLDEAAGTRREIHFTPLSIVEGSKYDFSRIDFTAEKIQNELFQRFDIAACPTIELNDNYLRLIGLIKEFCALAENIMSGSCKMSNMTNQQLDLIFSAVKAVDDLHASQDKGEDRDAEVDQQRRGLQRLAQLRQDWRVDRLGEGTQKGSERHHEGQQAWAHRFSASSSTDARRRMSPAQPVTP